MVISRNWPMRSMGMRSTRSLLSALCRLCAADAEAESLERLAKCVRKARFCDDFSQPHAEMDDRLCDLRSDAADNAIRSHQPRSGHGLDEMLRDEGIHRGHARDVNNCHLGTGLDDLLQQRFHDDLRSGAIQSAD